MEGPEALATRVSIAGSALESLALTYATAEVLELAPTIDVPAELMAAPGGVAKVGARISGRVSAVFVNAGDVVTSGAPLVTIESAEVGRAWADLIAARARESVARRALDRQESLLDGRVTSARAFEEAQGAWEVSSADLQAALTRLAALGVPVVEEPPENPALVTLGSPIGGVVTVRAASIGEWVEPSSRLIEVVDLNEIWLEGSVYEQQIRFIEVGRPVQVEVRAFPDDVFAGTVERIAGVLDETTRSVSVRVVLPNEGGRLRPGMFATARIEGRHAHEGRDLIAVPFAAVQEIDGRRAVFVPAGEGNFEVRTVHTGSRVGDMIEILTGLEAGEEVVADGSLFLKGHLLRATLAEEEEG